MSRLIESFWAGDRVSGTDADRHEDISRNGSFGFGDDAGSAETADLGCLLISAQIAGPVVGHVEEGGRTSRT